MAITEECRAFLDEHFKLENYAIAEDVPLKEWATLFGLRVMHIEGFDRLPKDDSTAQLHDNFRDPFNKEVMDEEYWEDDPIPAAIREFSALDYFLIQQKTPYTGNTFHFLQLHHDEYLLSDEYKDVAHSVVRFWCGFTNYVKNQEVGLDVHSRNVALEIKKGVRNVFSADLDVDLTFPDDVLKEAFGSWLTAKRASEHHLDDKPASMKKFNKSDISKWVKFRTLQYLDLFYAGLYFNCELSDDEIGHYLFRDKIEKRWVFNARDDMRTVKKYGAIIMNKWNLRALDNSLGD